ncbi:MAG: polymer-forming cytoskeletal protein [Verrucomicrobia bacterium]|nr:polymer-forming cytoskeletal protein [Verrucomicrobiota bacterium]
MDANSANKTMIADDIEIVGSIKSAGDIELACKLSGDLNCGGKATIGKSAVIKGNIAADSTSIQGQVNGNINVKDRIELKASARINGDIRAKRLTVEDGATFVGKSEVNPAGTSPAQKTTPDGGGAPDSGDKSKGPSGGR